ncbi:MAG TPA: glycerophosphodiester phosphodiesterase [Gemmatimonadota bacterium]|nr:glycerophosphodiester phosphodiesterase [Gemmatimonadota bacterium]
MIPRLARAVTFFSGPIPRPFAHRGASGTHPENTLIAFRKAREEGAEGFELDVHRTSDGEIVVFHDPTLERTTDGSGPLAALTLSELRELDAGSRFTPDGGGTHPFRGQSVRIPTLREVLEEFPEAPVIIEIKQVDPPLEEELREEIAGAGAHDRTLVFSLAQAPLDRYRALDPEQPTGFGPEDVADFLARLRDGAWDGYEPPGAAFAVPESWHGIPIVSAPFVEAAHRFDREVYVWTVNTEAEMERLLELGIDGLISDFPGRLAEVVRRRRAAV